jgi:predicted metal-dependent phosphoesterase TrpH
MKKYDLHMHTNFSPDSRNKPESILQLAKKAGLNGIAITDHHTIDGALFTRDLNKDKDFEVIVGEEITTNRGDVIALYIKEDVKERDLFKVIDNIRSQNGLVIIPHPFRPFRQRFNYPLERLVGKIDGIETLNSRNPDSSNKAAARVAKQLSLAAIGSSDAHILLDIGKGYTLFDGELRDAITERTTTSAGPNKFVIAFLSHLAATWFKGLATVLGLKNRGSYY